MRQLGKNVLKFCSSSVIAIFHVWKPTSVRDTIIKITDIFVTSLREIIWIRDILDWGYPACFVNTFSSGTKIDPIYLNLDDSCIAILTCFLDHCYF
jgi:hypothetical protein